MNANTAMARLAQDRVTYELPAGKDCIANKFTRADLHGEFVTHLKLSNWVFLKSN